MHRKLLTLAALGIALMGGVAAQAAPGVMPHLSTIHRLTESAEAVVKAKIVAIVDTPIEGIANQDTVYYRQNNNNDLIRRDARLEITRVIRGGEVVSVGTLNIVSLQQMRLHQYPASLQNGGEAIFFLHRRTFDGNWEVLGETRGVVTSETAGSVAAAEQAVDNLVITKTEFEGAHYAPALQDLLLADLKSGDTRISVDAAIEFGWHSAQYASHFNEGEKADLLNLLPTTARGSSLRQELITAIGRVKPAGGDRMLVDIIATDASVSVASLGSWALEQYGRPSSATMLLDKYVSVPAADTIGRARLLTALGIMRPRDNDQERVQRTRFTDVLKGALSNVSGNEVTEEALLAARDMRFTGNELGTQLQGVVDSFRAGEIIDEAVYKRAIVALAATRNTEAREYLMSLKGEFAGKFDKHIELSMLMPFTVLVDGK